jgi:cold shock CspA family protein
MLPTARHGRREVLRKNDIYYCGGQLARRVVSQHWGLLHRWSNACYWVAWFRLEKKFGFVALHSGEDAFLHLSILKAAGYVTLPPGTTVEVQIAQSGGKLRVTVRYQHGRSECQAVRRKQRLGVQVRQIKTETLNRSAGQSHLIQNWPNSSLGWLMDRAMQLRHLEQAERHVAQGERHIAEQEERIAELARHGYDTTQAQRLLNNFSHFSCSTFSIETESARS